MDDLRVMSINRNMSSYFRAGALHLVVGGAHSLLESRLQPVSGWIGDRLKAGLQPKRVVKRPSGFRTVGRFFVLSFIFCLGLAPGLLLAQDGKSVLTKSPFLPPGFGREVRTPEVPSGPQQGPLSREFEFRGVFQLGDTRQFSIFDRTNNKSRWVGVNEADERYSVVAYNPADRSITMRAGGRQETLSLMQATDTPLPVGNAKATEAPATSTGGTPAATVNPAGSQAAPRTPVVPRRRILRRATEEGGNGQGGQQAAPQRQSAAG